MSAVKSRTGGNLLGQGQSLFHHESTGPATAQPNQPFGFNHQNAQMVMHQNLRRPCTLSQANHGAFFQPGGGQQSQHAAASDNNFVFLTSNSGAMQQDENVITEKEKLESLKCLKVYFSDYTDAQLLAALRKVAWDSDKALDRLFEETYNQRNSANQKKHQETNSLYSQSRQHHTALTQQQNASSFSSQYQVAKPSKRRRPQFDQAQPQPNQSIMSRQLTNAAQQQQAQRPQVSLAAPQQPTGNQAPGPLLTTGNNSQQQPTSHQQQNQSAAQQPPTASNGSNSAATPPQQRSSNASSPSSNNGGIAQSTTTLDLSAARQYGSTIVHQLGSLLNQPSTPEHRHGIMLQALEHYADVAAKPVQEQLANLQRDRSRLQHENHIMRKGFKAMLKKQSEWCKQSEKLESMQQQMEQMQRENERMHFEMHNLRKQTQPEQHSYISASMHNTHDDVA